MLVTLETAAASAPRVWILEPDSSLRELVSQQLSTRGYEVRGFTDASETLDALESSEPPALLILEPILPFGDGMQVVQRMRGGPRTLSVPILVLTMDTSRDRRIEAIRLHVDYVQKPVTLAEVCRKVAKLCGRPVPADLE
ncbi:MAG: response regulator [Planctomycetes bacterium]|nr:response regulator [Planctomycetota bacterium]